VRERDLPAHVVIYYVIALALYMQSSYREVLRCLLEGVQWLLEPSASSKVAGNSGISQARSRLGWEPLRQLHDEIVKPIAVKATKGAWFRGWRLVSLDGSTLDVADEKNNDEAFGRPGASRGAKRIPADSFRIAGRNWHTRPFRHADGRLYHRRDCANGSSQHQGAEMATFAGSQTAGTQTRK
jgi:Insertion element 4 transposase N-terminal